MRRGAEFRGGSPQEVEQPKDLGVEVDEVQETPDEGLGDWFEVDTLDHAESATEADTLDVTPERRVEAREEAETILGAIRQHPFTRKVSAALLGVMGIGLVAGKEVAGSREADVSSSETVEMQADLAEALEDPVVEQEFQKLVLEELEARGEFSNEDEARYGKDSWSNDERVEYEGIPTLAGKFEYLHQDNLELIEAYRSIGGRIENFSTLYTMLQTEFGRSSLPYDFVDKTIAEAPEYLSGLDADEAFALWETYGNEVAKVGGLSALRELAQGLDATLPDEHPIVAHIERKGFLGDQFAELLTESEDARAFFDQNTGRIEILREANDKTYLIDAFPANGGPPDAVEWQKGLPAAVAVSTPDGKYTFDKAYEKKSSSWKSSWVLDSAPLRWANDERTAVQYQDADGRWRMLTGLNAEFSGFGAPERPFQLRSESGMYNMASKKVDGEWTYPEPFTVEDALGSDGELRPTWDKNDFGPKSIRIRNGSGDIMSIYFHSSPVDEDTNAFLAFSHGCIHMKPADVERMDGYLMKGSSIEIGAWNLPDVVAQTEDSGISGDTGVSSDL